MVRSSVCAICASCSYTWSGTSTARRSLLDGMTYSSPSYYQGTYPGSTTETIPQYLPGCQGALEVSRCTLLMVRHGGVLKSSGRADIPVCATDSRCLAEIGIACQRGNDEDYSAQVVSVALASCASVRQVSRLGTALPARCFLPNRSSDSITSPSSCPCSVR